MSIAVPSAVFEAFSITHAQILDGEMSFVEAALATEPVADDLDIYGVNNASLEPNSDSYENEGDDDVLSIWRWLTNADLTLQQGYMSLPLLARISKTPIETEDEGADTQFGMDLWHEDTVNAPPLPVILRMPSRDKKGNPRTATIGLYRVQFAPFGLDGPAYKDGLKVNLSGTALKSLWDEKGEPFADGKKRVGRILSHK